MYKMLASSSFLFLSHSVFFCFLSFSPSVSLRLPRLLSHPFALSLSCSFALLLSCSLALLLSRSLALSVSLSLSCSLSLPPFLSHTLTFSPTHLLSLSLPLSFCPILSLRYAKSTWANLTQNFLYVCMLFYTYAGHRTSTECG